MELMEPTLAEKVSVLQRELNLSEGESLVDAVDNALEKVGLADELRGQPLTKGRCGPSDPRRDTADRGATRASAWLSAAVRPGSRSSTASICTTIRTAIWCRTHRPTT